ncbi:menaquinone biosynthetic enzyme MqnA/MqnD family protein [Sediminibacterium soli]|uniref:menaquinone biosynthetic enzyme MqnA/MqnD family protein n=1 Tax=Sediminibacterium soli TaxID=2698829 RepID=UPI001F41611A|nr:menaquinone biosynthesis protein [Sediminibacterium soli]
MDKIRVGAVSYLNTKPLLYGLNRTVLGDHIEIREDYPARVAQMLLDDQIDVGLVPVAIIPKLADPHIITNYCIGTEGEVASVGIFSEVPMEEIRTVLLDYQSRTSVRLARLLLKEYWKKEVIIEHASEDFRSRINGTTAGVVIGDRALEQRSLSPCMYDLGAAWKAHTGLPFVFAAWVANKRLPVSFEKDFSAVNAYGLAHIPEVVAAHPYPVYDLLHYYTQNISYELTDQKREGLARFLDWVRLNG